MSRGARGFSQQPPDLTSRLVGPPGHPAPRGAAPYRYYNPTGGRQRRRTLRDRRGRLITPVSERPPETGAEAQARLLARILNDAIGINVRQPSSHTPPFRSRQFTFNTQATFTAALAEIPVDFGNMSFGLAAVPFPPGVRGVVKTLDFLAYSNNVDTLPLFWTSSLSLLKNNVVVPGFNVILPGMVRLEEITGAAGGPDIFGAVIPSPRLLVPLQLNEGDTLAIRTSGDTNTDFFVRLQGWVYPIESHQDNVVGTVADRGNMSGLALGG